MSHSYTKLLYHLVWSTKTRRPFIDETLQPRLLQYMGGIIRGVDDKLLIGNSMPDHVHLLVSLPPKLAIMNAIRDIKANASKWVHEEFPKLRQFGWQTGYGAFTVSASNESTVRRYIENQAQHHRRMTFQEEFIKLLTKHGIEYDRQYVFD